MFPNEVSKDKNKKKIFSGITPVANTEPGRLSQTFLSLSSLESLKSFLKVEKNKKNNFWGLKTLKSFLN